MAGRLSVMKIQKEEYGFPGIQNPNYQSEIAF